MKLIDRYFLAALARPLVYCLVAFYVLFILVDLFDTLTDIIRHKPGWGMLLQYYLLPAPYVFQQVIPAAYFFALVAVLIQWSGTRELVALHSGGISLHRVALPAFILALLLMAVQYVLFLDLSPRAQERREELKNIIENKQDRKNRFAAVVFKNPRTGTLWYAQEIDLNERTLKQAEILLVDDLGRDRMKIFAARGRYRPEGFWDLAGVRRVDFSRDGTASAPVDLAQMDVEFLTESPEELVAVARPAAGMPWGELRRFISGPAPAVQARMAPYRVEHQHRLAYPWLNPVLCLFAFALAVHHDRRSKAGAVFQCVLVICGLLVWMQLSLALGNGKRFSPGWAGWSPVLFFGLAGLGMFAVKTGWWWNLQHYVRQDKMTVSGEAAQ